MLSVFQSQIKTQQENVYGDPKGIIFSWAEACGSSPDTEDSKPYTR